MYYSPYLTRTSTAPPVDYDFSYATPVVPHLLRAIDWKAIYECLFDPKGLQRELGCLPFTRSDFRGLALDGVLDSDRSQSDTNGERKSFTESSTISTV